MYDAWYVDLSFTVVVSGGRVGSSQVFQSARVKLEG